VSVDASPSLDRAQGYRHEAFLWSGLDELLARTVPFVADAVRQEEPVMVAVIDEHWQPMRAALGPVADRVVHVDMARLGHNPARIIPAWREFVDRHATGRPLRGIGEPIWAGRRDVELVECQIHEAMLNVALPPRTPLWLMCPYDARALPDDVLAEARRSHPVVTGDATAHAAAGYAGWGHLQDLCTRALGPAGAGVRELPFGPGELSLVRAHVARAATARLGRARAADLALAVNELAANSLDHGGGAGVLRVWSEPGSLVCEVQDAGRITDPLVGRHSPRIDQPRGRGVWMVHQLCDLVQIRSTTAGTVVRVHTWL
jgi:anti-sigma regulatory factor (Ser/Thr protein kinase)